ncbi:MAG: exonuclease SbcCD subunit D [Candidatus Thermoplasmatota archaeon]
MVRLFHFSDTHLGHAQYNRTDPSGLNQREVDLAVAFSSVIDFALAERPDVVLHAGDLFDGVRPGNRPLAVAMEGFLKLSRAGIPTVVIAGNHEHPRLRETGSPFRLFEHLPNIHVVYKGRRETVELALKGKTVRVHAVPQCADNATLAREVTEAPTAAAGFDILVAHGAVPSLPAFSHAEFNEQTLDAGWFAPFDYVALGHYHGVQQVAQNAWYCGAPERVSIAEAAQQKGFLDVTLDGEVAKTTFRPLAGRPYDDITPIDCAGLDSAQVKQAALAALEDVAPGAVARLRLTQLDASLRGLIDLRAIRQAGERALHLDVRLEWADRADQAAGATTLLGLGEEWAGFLAAQELAGLDRAALDRLARTVLEAP